MWNNNEIQFARLLCEIVAEEDLPNWRLIRDAMDLTDEELHELFDRALAVWEDSKANN